MAEELKAVRAQVVVAAPAHVGRGLGAREQPVVHARRKPPVNAEVPLLCGQQQQHGVDGTQDVVRANGASDERKVKVD